jgi:hypothetical protein
MTDLHDDFDPCYPSLASHGAGSPKQHPDSGSWQYGGNVLGSRLPLSTTNLGPDGGLSQSPRSQGLLVVGRFLGCRTPPDVVGWLACQLKPVILLDLSVMKCSYPCSTNHQPTPSFQQSWPRLQTFWHNSGLGGRNFCGKPLRLSLAPIARDPKVHQYSRYDNASVIRSEHASGRVASKTTEGVRQ